MKQELLPLQVGKNIIRGFEGKQLTPGVVLLTDPAYQEFKDPVTGCLRQGYVAIANVAGMLCTVEVSAVQTEETGFEPAVPLDTAG